MAQLSTLDKLTVGRDEVGSVLADQQAQIDDLAGAQQVTGSIDVSQVEPASPFVVGTGRIKNGLIKLPIAFNVPKTIEELDLTWIRTADRDTDAHFEGRQFKQEDVAFDDPSLGTITVETPWLDANTQYDLLRATGRGQLLGRVRNPTDPPLRTDPPLATLTTGAAVNAPGKPTAARIIANLVDPDSDGSLSIVTLRIPADETEALTFAEQQIVAVQPKLVDDSGAKAPSPPVNIEDSSLTFIDDSIGGLVTGWNYTWPKNTSFNAIGDAGVALATSTVTFIAGGFRDPSDSLADLTLVAVTYEATEDPALLLVTFELDQPDPAYKLKNYTAKRKVSAQGDSDYDLPKNLVVDRGDLRDPTYSTPGSIFITFSMNVKPTKSYLVKLIARSIQGFVKEFISGTVTASALTVSARETAASGGNSLVPGGSLVASVKDYQDYRNTLDGSGAGAAGDAVYPGENWQTIANSGVRINNLATGVGGNTLDARGIRWMNTDKRLLLSTSINSLGGKPAARLGKPFRASNQAVICPLFLSSSGTVTITFIVALVDQVAGDMATVTMPLVITATEPARGFGIFTVSSSYAGTAKQWLEFRPQSNPSANIYLWNTQLDTGILFRDYKTQAYEQSVLDYLDASVNSVGSGAGIIVTEDEQGQLFDPVDNPGGQIYLT